jgi:hypothetical protein
MSSSTKVCTIKDYIDRCTVGFEELKTLVQAYDPTSAAKICGIDEDTIRLVARTYAQADAAMSIWTMGINQSTHGSDGVSAINNLESHHWKYWKTRRYFAFDYWSVQCDGNTRVVFLFWVTRLSDAGKATTPRRNRTVLEYRGKFFSSKARLIRNRYFSQRLKQGKSKRCG